MQAILALEDGAVFTGQAFGAQGTKGGEVVFNVSMTGYQEILTDPSYCGQIVVMTYPLIGNYGINEQDFEAAKSYVNGFVVREECSHPSNWRSGSCLSDFLARQGVVGISGIDTRALTRHLREQGTMRGVLSTECLDPALLCKEAGRLPRSGGKNLVPQVATKEAYTLDGSGHRVAVLDFGAKLNIIRHLQERDCAVVVVPPTTPAAEIMALNPDGVLLSNGPGDPMDVPYAVRTVKELMGRLPMFGICLGHQIMALALGAKTYKMKFGHRGANHPVKDMITGKVCITSHNHGFSVDEKSLEGLPVIVSHRNLNDNTVEGISHKHLPFFSVQYHPEASPGPQESAYLFDRFVDLMDQQGK